MTNDYVYLKIFESDDRYRVMWRIMGYYKSQIKLLVEIE